MNKLFFDLESNSLNPYSSEIITGSFKLTDDDLNMIDGYYFESQVNKWCEDAAAIHKISKSEMLTYPDKKKALDNLCNWLSKLDKYEAVVFANPNNELGRIHYDCALMQMELMNHLEVDRLEMQPFKPQNIISVHTMAKDAEKAGLFRAIKNPDTNRKSFTQVNVYKALFDEVYDAHDAVADVNAMGMIYKELKHRELTGEIHRQQWGGL
jgi:hypothetical protein